MAKDKSSKVSDVIEPVISTEPEIDEAKRDAIAAALIDMNHEEPAIWNEDGSPSEKYISATVGFEVTTADIEDVAAGYVRQPKTPEELKALGIEAPQAEIVVPDAPPAPTHEQLSEHLRIAEADVVAKQASHHAAAVALNESQKKRDALLGRVSATKPDSFASIVQEMQKRTFETNLARHNSMKKFVETTGGAVPSAFASPLDARLMTRRSIARRAQRDAQ